MPLLLIHSLLPKLCRSSVVQHKDNISKKSSKPTKVPNRIIFHEIEFAHTWEHFKENNILNIYQSNIFNNFLFLYWVKNEKTTNVFLSKFWRSSHHYATSFSQKYYFAPSFAPSNKKQTQKNNTCSKIVKYYLEHKIKTYRKPCNF